MEELQSTTLLGSLARGHGADHSGAARLQRFLVPPAAESAQTQPGLRALGRSRGGAARQLRHLGAPAADLDGGTASQVLATAELLGTTRLGITDCGPCVLWWSRGSYVPEQAPQGTMGRGLGWSRGPYGPEEQHDFGGGSRG